MLPRSCLSAESWSLGDNEFLGIRVRLIKRSWTICVPGEATLHFVVQVSGLWNVRFFEHSNPRIETVP